MIKIKIEAIHDVVCSWCPIGRRNIKAALKVFDKQIEAEIIYLPFELNPDMPPEGEAIEAHLMRRNDWTKAQFLHYRSGLIETARNAGFIYDFSKRTHYYNTAKAHRLIHFAQASKKQEAVVEALTEQYFTHGVNVNQNENLLDIATSVGLDRKQIESVLSSEEVHKAMQEKYDRIKQFSIHGAPAFIVNHTEFVQGSNSVEFFVQYFERIVQASR